MKNRTSFLILGLLILLIIPGVIFILKKNLESLTSEEINEIAYTKLEKVFEEARQTYSEDTPTCPYFREGLSDNFYHLR